MEIEINDYLLSDSPYCERNKKLFSSDQFLMGDLIEDILRDNPTCYLISGYRGAGKSSFIEILKEKIKKRIEADIQNNETSSNEKPLKEILFVHTNFSRYHNQTNLLRKLIRGLYLAIENTNAFTKHKGTDKGLKAETIESLKSLYEKTFFDTSNNYLESAKKERVTILNIDLIAILKVTVATFVTTFSICSLFNHTLPFICLTQKIALLVSGLIGGIYSGFELKRSFSKSKIEQANSIRKSLYDDEIAEHHFTQALRSLREKFHILFVLDELDKVEESELESLLKEMKPYLVSGLASFIAVAGQQLFYRYANSSWKDDAILSSIFSKIVHVPLLSTLALRDVFIERIIKNKDQYKTSDLEVLKQYADYLIFQSKRIPRKFISLIRDEITYQNGTALIIIDDNTKSFELYSRLIQVINQIDEQQIATDGFEHATRDFLVMQLFIACHILVFNKSIFLAKGKLQNTNDDRKGDMLPILEPFIKNYIDKLLNELESAKLIYKSEANNSIEYKLNFDQAEEMEPKPTNIVKPLVVLDAKTNMFSDVIELRNIVNNIFHSLTKNTRSNATYKQMFQYAKENNILNIDDWQKGDKMMDIIDTLNDLNGDSEAASAVEEIFRINRIDLNVVELGIVEKYLKIIVEGFFRDKDYLVDSRADILKDAGIDFSLVHRESQRPRLLFVTKLRRKEITPDIDLVFQSLRTLRDINTEQQNAFLFLVVFTHESTGAFGKAQFSFKNMLRELDEFKIVKDYIRFVPVSLTSLKTLEDALHEFSREYLHQSFAMQFEQQEPPIGYPDRNDHILDQPFQFKKANIKIEIRPSTTTKYWRLGFVFSKDDSFPRISQDRHHDNDNKFAWVHLNVGEPQDNGIWKDENILKLNLYPKDILKRQSINPLKDNYNGNILTFSLQSNDNGSEVQFIVEDIYMILGFETVDLSKFEYCKISAWCDGQNFSLNTIIDIRRKWS